MIKTNSLFYIAASINRYRTPDSDKQNVAMNPKHRQYNIVYMVIYWRIVSKCRRHACPNASQNIVFELQNATYLPVKF